MPKSKHHRKRKKSKKKSRKGKEVWVSRIPAPAEPDYGLDDEDDYDEEEEENRDHLPFGVMRMSLEEEAAAHLEYEPEPERHPEFEPATPRARQAVNDALQRLRPGQQACIGVVAHGVCVSAVFAKEKEAAEWLDDLSELLETDYTGDRFVRRLDLESQDGPERRGIDGFREVPTQIEATAYVAGLIVSKMAAIAEYEEMWQEEELEKSTLLRAAAAARGTGARLTRWHEEKP